MGAWDGYMAWSTWPGPLLTDLQTHELPDDFAEQHKSWTTIIQALGGRLECVLLVEQ